MTRVRILWTMMCCSYGILVAQAEVVVPTEGFGCDGNGRSLLYTNLVVSWGDMHSHSSYSDDAAVRQGCTRPPYEAAAFCASYLDFVAISDHAEAGMPGEYTLEKWTRMQDQLRLAASNFPQLIIFPSFEYTQTGASFPTNWTIPAGNGHKIFHCYDLDHIPTLPVGMDMMGSCLDVWAYLNAQPAAGYWLTATHHSSKGSEPKEIGEYHDPFISMATDWSTQYVNGVYQPFVEVYSRHGSSEMPGCEEPVNNPRPEGTVNSALGRWLEQHNPGYKLGIIGSTDTHFGDPGWTVEDVTNVQQWLGFYTGGLAATLTTNRSRAEIWNALRSRHCYGTSGERIQLEFTAKMGAELAGMGDTIYHTNALGAQATAQVNLHVWAQDPRLSNNISRIQVFRNATMITDVTTQVLTARLDFTDELTNSHAYYRAKVWMSFPTLNPSCLFERAWSSPIWIERRAVSSGNLQVTIEPEAARLAGARWRVEGGAWLESGAIAQGIPAGERWLDFSAVSNGSVPPSARFVTITDGATTITNLAYTAAPVILVQPSSLDKYSGESATFSVWAGGMMPITYQWRHPGGQAIAGATNASYTIASVTTDDHNTFYRCVISNAEGVVTSSPPARLTVTDQVPLLLAQPEATTNDAATTAIFDVSADGSRPLHYQWQKEGSPLAGATQFELVVQGVMASNIGVYRCIVSNGIGVTASSNATLSVRPMAEWQSVSTLKNHSVDITLTCRFGGAVNYSIARQPVHGTLTHLALPQLRFVPAAGFTGSDTLVYEVAANGLTNGSEIALKILADHGGVPWMLLLQQ